MSDASKLLRSADFSLLFLRLYLCKSNLIIVLNEKIISAAATSLVLMVTNNWFSVFFMLVMVMEVVVRLRYVFTIKQNLIPDYAFRHTRRVVRPCRFVHLWLET
jgi:hypothetical protein